MNSKQEERHLETNSECHVGQASDSKIKELSVNMQQSATEHYRGEVRAQKNLNRLPRAASLLFGRPEIEDQGSVVMAGFDMRRTTTDHRDSIKSNAPPAEHQPKHCGEQAARLLTDYLHDARNHSANRSSERILKRVTDQLAQRVNNDGWLPINSHVERFHAQHNRVVTFKNGEIEQIEHANGQVWVRDCKEPNIWNVREPKAGHQFLEYQLHGSVSVDRQTRKVSWHPMPEHPKDLDSQHSDRKTALEGPAHQSNFQNEARKGFTIQPYQPTGKKSESHLPSQRPDSKDGEVPMKLTAPATPEAVKHATPSLEPKTKVSPEKSEDKTPLVSSKDGVSFVPNELLVMGSESSTRTDVLQAVRAAHGTVIRTFGDGPMTVYVVRADRGRMDEALSTLAKDKCIESVQRNDIAARQPVIEKPVRPDTDVQKPSPLRNADSKDGVKFVPNELLIMASDSSKRADVLQAVRAAHGTVIGTRGDGPMTVYVVRTDRGRMEEALSSLSNDKRLRSVQRNYISATQPVIENPAVITPDAPKHNQLVDSKPVIPPIETQPIVIQPIDSQLALPPIETQPIVIQPIDSQPLPPIETQPIDSQPAPQIETQPTVDTPLEYEERPLTTFPDTPEAALLSQQRDRMIEANVNELLALNEYGESIKIQQKGLMYSLAALQSYATPSKNNENRTLYISRSGYGYLWEEDLSDGLENNYKALGETALLKYDAINASWESMQALAVLGYDPAELDLDLSWMDAPTLPEWANAVYNTDHEINWWAVTGNGDSPRATPVTDPRLFNPDVMEAFDYEGWSNYVLSSAGVMNEPVSPEQTTVLQATSDTSEPGSAVLDYSNTEGTDSLDGLVVDLKPLIAQFDSFEFDANSATPGLVSMNEAQPLDGLKFEGIGSTPAPGEISRFYTKVDSARISHEAAALASLSHNLKGRTPSKTARSPLAAALDLTRNIAKAPEYYQLPIENDGEVNLPSLETQKEDLINQLRDAKAEDFLIRNLESMYEQFKNSPDTLQSITNDLSEIMKSGFQDNLPLVRELLDELDRPGGLLQGKSFDCAANSVANALGPKELVEFARAALVDGSVNLGGQAYKLDPSLLTGTDPIQGRPPLERVLGDAANSAIKQHKGFDYGHSPDGQQVVIDKNTGQSSYFTGVQGDDVQWLMSGLTGKQYQLETHISDGTSFGKNLERLGSSSGFPIVIKSDDARHFVSAAPSLTPGKWFVLDSNLGYPVEMTVDQLYDHLNPDGSNMTYDLIAPPKPGITNSTGVEEPSVTLTGNKIDYEIDEMAAESALELVSKVAQNVSKSIKEKLGQQNNDDKNAPAIDEDPNNGIWNDGNNSGSAPWTVSHDGDQLQQGDYAQPN